MHGFPDGSDLEALAKVAWQCSHYEDGTRYCDYCGQSVFGKRQQNQGVDMLRLHDGHCPIHRIYRKLALGDKT